MSELSGRGALAIVLHTHMPYVEGFGTWPFGEEWLWEAMASCYVPLLDLLDGGAPLTLSLTPVLCDQLESPGIAERFSTFIEEVRCHTHQEDAKGLRAGGHDMLAVEVERSWADYRGALEALERRGGDLLGALSPHAQWTSSSTHAVLPLLATDASARLQVQAGVRAHRRRFGHWRGGFWLPECAHTSQLEPLLTEAGTGAVCVELTKQLGLGSARHLRPIGADSGLTLVPLDRCTMSLVWSDDGYPSSPVYRDYHHHTVHHHNPWDNAGGAYDRPVALRQAQEHAADFVSRTLARLAEASRSGRRGAEPAPLMVCAFDTELLGHWWYEGLDWLKAVIEESSRQGLELLRLDDALQVVEPLPACGDETSAQASSWGTGGDLSTWSGPAVGEMAFAMRAAELRVVAAREPGEAAIRQLMALQASDWPFMVSRGLTVPYARERFEGHRMALEGALAADGEEDLDALRNLAVDAGRGAELRVP